MHIPMLIIVLSTVVMHITLNKVLAYYVLNGSSADAIAYVGNTAIRPVLACGIQCVQLNKWLLNIEMERLRA